MRLKVYVLTTLCILFIAAAYAEEIQPDVVVEIPMRDGALLPTDIYLPSPDARNLPTILVRTPSGRRAFYQAYQPLTKAGYVVAIQDARNFVDQEGKTFPWLSDGWGELQDGYDTVEWLAKSPYSNGKVGTMGFSAMGISQLLLAPTAPPSLKAQYIGFAVSDMYRHAIYHGGTLRKNQVEGWIGYCAKDPSVLSTILSIGQDDDFWGRIDCLSQVCRMRLPALHYGGWYDTFSQGTLDTFAALQAQGGPGAKGRQILVMGPWTHHWPRSMKIGDFDIPENGRFPPFDISPKSWFDYYLKGDSNGIDKLPAVTYYVMGPLDGTSSKGNIWKTATSWPIPAKPWRLYLQPAGKLADTAASIGSMRFKHDPENPVPTLGGRNLFLEAGAKDQTPLEERSDVLVFTTDVFSEDMEVTGRISAALYISSDAKDADIAVRLTDVYPDGKSVLIADGVRRLSNVRKFDGSSTPVEVKVDLLSTSQVFAKGHRLRISISGSNYPQFDLVKDPSENVVLFGSEAPSHVTLPLVD
ncbi:MAG: CocE/NonD family hydrolase [Chlamydiia bacterium]|nr:CocE/NonD family hydrolase [Chlamydiia bacterium]